MSTTESSRAALMRQGLLEMGRFCQEFDQEGAFKVCWYAGLCVRCCYCLKVPHIIAS
jgi:glycerol-3-phosphate dehydrogenase